MDGSRADLLVEGLCSIIEAAEFLSLSRTSIYAAMDRGELPFVKFGKARRIPKRALLMWAERNLHGGGAS